MFNKVFISYAPEDITYASKLYTFLANNKYDPWMDKKKLKVGDNCDIKAKEALKESDFISTIPRKERTLQLAIGVLCW